MPSRFSKVAAGLSHSVLFNALFFRITVSSISSIPTYNSLYRSQNLNVKTDDRFLWIMTSFNVLFDRKVRISRKQKLANVTVGLDMGHFKTTTRNENHQLSG
jgi:hypothetical protein